MKKIQKADGFENQYLFVLQRELLESYAKDPLFASCLVTDIGFFPNAQYHYRKRSKGSSEWIMLLCVAGKGYYRIGDGETRYLKAAQAIVLPPNVSHEYGADESQPWSVYWAHFSGNAMEMLSQQWAHQQPVALKITDTEQALQLLKQCFELLKKPCQKEEYFAVCQYTLSLFAMLQLALKHENLAMTEKGHLAIQIAATFMKQNLHRQLTLQDIASATNFSASHISALFKAATGHPPLDYFLRMKMQDASKVLYFTSRPVKDISLAYGISDSCYFSRLFKKHMGMSPQQYRNLQKG